MRIEPRMVQRIAALVVAVFAACAECAASEFQWNLPRGFPVPAVPADNPMSAAKVALGKRLFFEPRMSITGQHSCASCHDPERAFTDGRATAVGALGQALPHSAMALVNVAYNVSFGWTQAHVRSLESQMREPLFNEHPVELGLKGRESEVVAQLARDASYRDLFGEAFPNEPVQFDHIIKAIAAFERTLISGNSPFDRYVFSGDHSALSDAAKRGMNLFYSERVRCGACHSGFNFSGNWRDAQGDTGEPSFARNGVSTRPMRVPTLRNVSLTAPYMHDGRFASLEAVIDHYTDSSKDEAPRDAKMHAFSLTAAERSDLIAFLMSLTSADP
jgi:cytochrome c peroxidase